MGKANDFLEECAERLDSRKSGYVTHTEARYYGDIRAAEEREQCINIFMVHNSGLYISHRHLTLGLDKAIAELRGGNDDG
jgi:hypothetical protein